MAHGLSELIVAPITGRDRAAVALVRVSGPGAWALARRVFRVLPAAPQARYAIYGHFAHGDDGYCLLFAEGQSFTGEESAEFHLHGSPVSVAQFLEICVTQGARMARPGEFTLRAFLNGRIDLTQAEAVRDTVDALTENQLRAAHRQRDGALRARLGLVRDDLVGCLAMVEASTDFSEEVGDLDRPALATRVKGVQAELDALLATQRTGAIMRHGAAVAIVGLPNAGKSSLFNALLGRDRAIVTPIAGTTRDTVEEWLDLGGVPARIVDTAGLRPSEDTVEQMGIERSREALRHADVVWHVYDATLGWSEGDEALLQEWKGRPGLVIANKCDEQPQVAKGIPVSALTGQGLTALTDWMQDWAGQPNAEIGTVNPRHAESLTRVQEALGDVQAMLTQPVPDDLAAVGLGSAIRILGEITGETTPPDVLTRIFQDFCIGK